MYSFAAPPITCNRRFLFLLHFLKMTNKAWYFLRTVCCWQMILMKYHTLIFRKLGKIVCCSRDWRYKCKRWCLFIHMQDDYTLSVNIYYYYITLILSSFSFALSTFIPFISLGAQWLSCRVLDPPAALCCVLEQNTFILDYYWFNPGIPVPT